MHLPSYLSISYFLCGLAQGRLFRSLPGRSSFATEKVCRCDEGPWCLQSAGCVHPASWRVKTSHESTVARWCIFRLSAAAHHHLSQVQTVPWTCRQWVAASRGLMACTTLPNAVGCSSVPSGKRVDHWITFCIHTHAHMEWQLLFWPSLAPTELAKGSSLGQRFSSSQSKSFPPPMGLRTQTAAPQLPCRIPSVPDINPGHASGTVRDWANQTHLYQSGSLSLPCHNHHLSQHANVPRRSPWAWWAPSNELLRKGGDGSGLSTNKNSQGHRKQTRIICLQPHCSSLSGKLLLWLFWFCHPAAQTLQPQACESGLQLKADTYLALHFIVTAFPKPNRERFICWGPDVIHS